MKKILSIALIYVFIINYSQIGIGTTTPNSSSIIDMDVSSLTNKKGFLPPIVSLKNNTDITTINTPINGLTAYNLVDGGSGATLIKGNRVSYWDSTKWQSLTNLGEIRVLKQPIDYINSSITPQNLSTDNTLTTFNNSQLVIVKWSATDEIVANPNDIILSNNIFTFKTAGVYQLTGSIIAKTIINSTQNTQIVMVLQTSTDGTTWTNIFGTSTPIERLVGNKAQTLSIPQILHRFAANTQMRIMLFKPSNVTNAATGVVSNSSVQANSGIIPNVTGDSTKSIRFTRIRE